VTMQFFFSIRFSHGNYSCGCCWNSFWWICLFFFGCAKSNMKRSTLTDADTHESGVTEQLHLFWFSDPQLVIILIQFMQFGYALALAIILVFWKDLRGPGAPKPYWYLIVVCVCYGIFLKVMAQAIPQFTLCTSLGHLIRKKHLQETIALYRLEEAQRMQKRKLALSLVDAEKYAFENDSVALVSLDRDEVSQASLDRSHRSLGSQRESLEELRLAAESQRSLDLLAELVKSDTRQLRTILPPKKQESMLDRDQRMKARRNRRKVVSEGVAAMRGLGKGMSPAAFNSSGQPSDIFNTKTVQPAAAGKEAAARAVDDSKVSKRSELTSRRKSVSASAVIQSWQDFSVVEKDATTTPAPSGSGGWRSKSKTPPRVGLHPLMEHTSPEVASPTVEEENDQMDLAATRIVDVVPPQMLSTAESEMELEGDDNATIGTAKSIGGLSDVDEPKVDADGAAVVPYIPPSLKGTVWNNFKPEAVKERLKNHFLGKGYLTVSHIFGTLICFFLVGQRVEAMLATTGVTDHSDNTSELKLEISFWWQMTWHILFLAGSGMMYSLLPKPQHESLKDRALRLSVALDILITGACLTLLLVAESQRCCEEEDTPYDDGRARFLAGGEDAGKAEYYDDFPLYGSDVCRCPVWGRRTYGGLGNIEPFTSLIGLRIIRFVVANAIVKYADRRSPLSKNQYPEMQQQDAPLERPEKSPFRSLLFGETDRESMQDENGTALELWERAIGKYPDIVARYGEFSGELFQAMLGLEIIDEKSLAALDTTESRLTFLAVAGTSQRLKLRGKQYTRLPPEAQGIIMAGKLGRRVKCVSVEDLPTLAEETEKLGRRVKSASVEDLPTLTEETITHEDDYILGSHISSPTAPAEFEIDNEQVALEENDGFSSFIDPSARLVRSMRRCDRKLLPLLNNWMPVDVVITQLEIVYFELVDDQDDLRMSTLLALNATKGGNGLRLCDVAAGRKVVGHLDLSEVTEVHVERDMPLEELALLDEMQQSNTADEPPTEYWQTASRHVSESDAARPPRNIRWAKIKEDRLKLTSMHGTLVLRYYSDLEDSETHPDRSAMENEEHGTLTKNIAFQWAQTIARFCGRDHLKQMLPHFGDDTSEELRDYLEVVHYHEKEAEKEAHKKGHVRKRSTALGQFDHPVSPKKSSSQILKASTSFGDNIELPTGAKTFKTVLRRAVSAGDADVSYKSRLSERAAVDG
jgi:hypothetical protein